MIEKQKKPNLEPDILKGFKYEEDDDDEDDDDEEAPEDATDDNDTPGDRVADGVGKDSASNNPRKDSNADLVEAK